MINIFHKGNDLLLDQLFCQTNSDLRAPVLASAESPITQTTTLSDPTGRSYLRLLFHEPKSILFLPPKTPPFRTVIVPISNTIKGKPASFSSSVVLTFTVVAFCVLPDLSTQLSPSLNHNMTVNTVKTRPFFLDWHRVCECVCARGRGKPVHE